MTMFVKKERGRVNRFSRRTHRTPETERRVTSPLRSAAGVRDT